MNKSKSCELCQPANRPSKETYIHIHTDFPKQRLSQRLMMAVRKLWPFKNATRQEDVKE